MTVSLDGLTVTTPEGVVYNHVQEGEDLPQLIPDGPVPIDVIRRESLIDSIDKALAEFQELARAWNEAMEPLDKAAARRGTTPAYLRVRLKRGTLQGRKLNLGGKEVWYVHRDA